MKLQEISIVCSSKTLKGEFSMLEIADFAIKLTEPESHLIGYSNHIPYFALSQNSFLDVNGEISDYCMVCATKILISLYNSYRFIEENRTKVNKVIIYFRNLINESSNEAFIQPDLSVCECKEIKRVIKLNDKKFKEYLPVLTKLKMELLDRDFGTVTSCNKYLDIALEKYFNCQIPNHIRTYIYNKSLEL
jgi:hypothetical protein